MSLSPRPHERLFGPLIWLLILIAVAVFLDAPVSEWIHNKAALIEVRPWIQFLKAPGHFLFTVILALVVAAVHPARLRAASQLLVAGILSGLVGAILKWNTGRIRPFKGVPPFELHPFRDGFSGLFGERNLSFPSGHACLAFATAATLALLWPRWKGRWICFAVAVLVACQRVVDGAHYPSDVVGSFGVGVFCAYLANALFKATGTASAGQMEPHPT